MRRFHITIAGLMGLVLFLALSITGLRHCSGLFGGVTFLLSLGLLMLAVIGAVYQRGGRRAFCLGVSLFGWGYVAMASSSWDDADGEAGKWDLVTTEILDRVRQSIEVVDDDSLDWFGYSDPRTRRIWAELEKPVSMPFGNETPIEEVIKYIKTATSVPGLERGIPIYIDPVGLSEAEKTMASPVTLNLDGVPLKTTLKLMLDQLDLTFRVRGGVLRISSRDGKSASSGTGATYHFRRVGHCLIALVVGCIGGFAACRVNAARELADVRTAAETGEV